MDSLPTWKHMKTINLSLTCSKSVWDRFWDTALPLGPGLLGILGGWKISSKNLVKRGDQLDHSVPFGDSRSLPAERSKPLRSPQTSWRPKIAWGGGFGRMAEFQNPEELQGKILGRISESPMIWWSPKWIWTFPHDGIQCPRSMENGTDTLPRSLTVETPGKVTQTQ